MQNPTLDYIVWLEDTYGKTEWPKKVKTADAILRGFGTGVIKGIIEGIVDTAGLAYQLVVDPQQVGKDMLYAAEYLIQNRELVVEAAKQMYANFESASPEEKAEMIGKVSSILVPGMGVTKAGKAAKVPEALSSMTQAVKTSKIMNVLANPIKKFKEIDWKSYTIRFQDWVQSLKPGRYAITPEGMLVRIPDETSSVVRRIDAGDGKKIEGTGKFNDPVITKTNKGLEIEFVNPHGSKIKWVDQNPKNIPNAIESAKNSSNSGKAIEGKVGNYVQQNMEIKGFGLKLDNISTGKPAGDIDVMTNNQIIEVKKSISAVKLDQIDKYVNRSNPQFFNYEGREIVLYVDEIIDTSNPQVTKMIQELNSKGVKVVNDLEELGGVLK
ncbi:hypothetical protein [Paenibacillus aquistagni]|uniref:hypothetical protein n=1 Tax=Paenibacillus aquistagni TaxID=1852522 RepID=UPI00145A3590|nr:hypothetical protein [Paenibacillus aquistagni]NMM55424.1 hypothetical protein [Paenibacillus aquistagni]